MSRRPNPAAGSHLRVNRVAPCGRQSLHQAQQLQRHCILAAPRVLVEALVLQALDPSDVLLENYGVLGRALVFQRLRKVLLLHNRGHGLVSLCAVLRRRCHGYLLTAELLGRDHVSAGTIGEAPAPEAVEVTEPQTAAEAGHQGEHEEEGAPGLRGAVQGLQVPSQGAHQLVRALRVILARLAGRGLRAVSARGRVSLGALHRPRALARVARRKQHIGHRAAADAPVARRPVHGIQRRHLEDLLGRVDPVIEVARAVGALFVTARRQHYPAAAVAAVGEEDPPEAPLVIVARSRPQAHASRPGAHSPADLGLLAEIRAFAEDLVVQPSAVHLKGVLGAGEHGRPCRLGSLYLQHDGEGGTVIA
mmetsp:Transcript_59643/g.153617  ORF Transcript_59643/g.153617 Transcript_59643/m.153617 type:complete len:363 (+) Transcript_59643:1767-2855(+)